MNIIMPLKDAKKIAVTICCKLQPFCEKINIAGSLRRLKPLVKDIEIICVPKVESKTPNGKSKWKCVGDFVTLPPVWKSEEEFFNWINVKMLHPSHLLWSRFACVDKQLNNGIKSKIISTNDAEFYQN